MRYFTFPKKKKKMETEKVMANALKIWRVFLKNQENLSPLQQQQQSPFTFLKKMETEKSDGKCVKNLMSVFEKTGKSITIAAATAAVTLKPRFGETLQPKTEKQKTSPGRN